MESEAELKISIGPRGSNLTFRPELNFSVDWILAEFFQRFFH
jgi:hypothetical protein